MKNRALGYELLLLLVSVIWGTTFVAQQIGMERGLGPMTYNALRFALGALVLLPVIRWRKTDDTGVPVKGSLLAGLFLFAAASFQQVGLKYTSSANAGFITGLYIVMVPLIGLFLGQKARRSLWVGVAVCVVGLYLLSVTAEFTIGKGDLLVLVCAVLWAFQILVIDHVAQRGDPIRIAALQFAVCTGLSGVAAVVFEQWTLDALRAGAGAVAYGGILSVGVAFTLQVVCQKRCPAGPAAVIMSMEAVFAALAGYLVLQQTLSPRAMVGCGLMLAGMLIVQWMPLVKRKLHP